MSDRHERGRFGVAIDLEHRFDKPGGLTTVCHPNGTKASTGDYALSNVFAREMFRLHQEKGGPPANL